MNKSKILLIIFLTSLITSCADTEEAPVEVYYGDVTNEQMFINIKNNDLNEVKRFVEINRKYLNIKDENGYTPLMLSALYNQIETARFLLENPDTRINFKENYNATALCVASIWGNTDVSEILIEYGADPSTPCFNPSAPIENACRANLSEEILSQYKEIAEFYEIEYDENKIQEGRNKCLEFFKQQRLNS
tara:strand:- start:260 stop:832 length:573 start_codon:yes stop_codon:yes gene_type:complete